MRVVTYILKLILIKFKGESAAKNINKRLRYIKRIGKGSE